jgi:hypothetical protein
MQILAVLLCVLSASLVTSKTTVAERLPRASEASRETRVGSDELVGRFLASATPRLTSYKARRMLTASTRGGKMTASLVAWTWVDANGRFDYDITNEEGSDFIRRRVLVAALEEERRTRDENDTSGDVTPANYMLQVDENRNGDFLRIHLRPLRKSAHLIEGTAFVTHDGLDMVRVEGQLSKRPSFWTRRVDITRRYARVCGRRVPIEMQSRADVRFVGDSTFSMTYDYETINGQPVR